MKRFLVVLLSLVIIAGGLYGAWVALEFFDSTRAAYREELARSQLLNITNQQRIADLLEENSRLRAELHEIRSLPAFAEANATDDSVNILPNNNIDPQDEEELEEPKNVRHQTNQN